MIETYYSWMETPPFAFDDYQSLKEDVKITNLKGSGGGSNP